MSATAIQYISNADGNFTDVVIPIELWREIESERETAYLLKSEAMKQRLLEAKKRQEGVSFDDVCKKLGI
ncbi:prevent-host-death protein [bacterium]|nr:prevent-host-death protein [bacterium]MBU1752360.1 prevent-host-death protein [bacterium]